MAFEPKCPTKDCQGAVLTDEGGNEMGGYIIKEGPQKGKKVPLTATKVLSCAGCGGQWTYGPYTIKESGQPPKDLDEELLKTAKSGV